MSNQECIDWNSCSNLSTPQNSGKQIPVKICAWVYKKNPNKVICYRKPPEQPDWVCVEADSYQFELTKQCDTYTIKYSVQIRVCYKNQLDGELISFTNSAEMCSFPVAKWRRSRGYTLISFEFLNRYGQTSYLDSYSTTKLLYDNCYTDSTSSKNPDSNAINASLSPIKILGLFQKQIEVPCIIKLYKDTEQGKVLVHEKTFQTGCPEVKEQEANTVCELEKNPSKTATIFLTPPEYLEVECYENNFNFLSLPLGPIPLRQCSRVKKIPFSFDPILKFWIKLFPIVVFEACSEEDCPCPIVKTSCSDCGEDCPEGTCLECTDGSGNVCCIGEDGTVLAIVQKNTQCL